jgi:hypothetical protein
LKSKHGESLRRAANDRWHEKIEQVMREKEELERKCEKLIYSQHQLNTKLVEARRKIQKITSSSGINNDQLRKEGRSREKALRRVLKEHQLRISLLEAELAEKIEALHQCKGELQGQLCSFEGWFFLNVMFFMFSFLFNVLTLTTCCLAYMFHIRREGELASTRIRERDNENAAT